MLVKSGRKTKGNLESGDNAIKGSGYFFLMRQYYKYLQFPPYNSMSYIDPMMSSVPHIIMGNIPVAFQSGYGLTWQN